MELLRRAREKLREGKTAQLERILRRSLQEVRALGGLPPERAEEILEAMRSLEGEIRERLEEAGIAVEGTAVDADDLTDSLCYAETRPLFTFCSHPLSDIIAKVNRPSQNFIAETLQKTLGEEFGKEGSAYAGRQVQLALYDSLGMDTRNLQIRDGSGLSRHDLVSPNTSVALLQMMWDHPYRSYYLESFPLAGRFGTIRKRMIGTAAEANVRAKTGFIGYVRSLSGYTWTRSGEPIIFSLMVNHYTIPTSQANQLQDRIAALLSEME